MSHIFISYSHDDSDYARKLESALKQRGFEVWIDDRIDYGTRWPQVIQEQLDASAAVIVIMTPRAWESNWVQNELARAQRKRKALFPLLLEGDCWFAFEATQYVDMRNGRLPSNRFYDRLAQVVLLRAVAPEAPAFPIPPFQEKTRVPFASRPLEPEMVLIPAGEFLMGSDVEKDRYADKNEQPQHSLYLPDYYIAKTPVTNKQYLVYVQDDPENDRSPAHWGENKRPKRDQEDHPVTNVTWYDARAYCEWLTKRLLKLDSTLDPLALLLREEGWEVQLPTEAQWEKAARGNDGRLWPWGNKWNPAYANCCPAGKDKTTPVGQYSPAGDSVYGCVDMAGNVWEWTRSLWGQYLEESEFKYPYNPTDGREDQNKDNDVFRVIRSGSFHVYWVLTRCASRLGEKPDWIWNTVGFRVCIAPKPE